MSEEAKVEDAAVRKGCVQDWPWSTRERSDRLIRRPASSPCNSKPRSEPEKANECCNQNGYDTCEDFLRTSF